MGIASSDGKAKAVCLELVRSVIFCVTPKTVALTCTDERILGVSYVEGDAAEL